MFGDHRKDTTLGTRFSATMLQTNAAFREKVIDYQKKIEKFGFWTTKLGELFPEHPSKMRDYGTSAGGHYKPTVVHPFVRTKVQQDDFSMGMNYQHIESPADAPTMAPVTEHYQELRARELEVNRMAADFYVDYFKCEGDQWALDRV